MNSVISNRSLPIASTPTAWATAPKGFWIARAITSAAALGLQLDGKNRPIFEPTVFDINTSIQRCLVKAIALHGLGLYVYAGEDLPSGEEPPQPKVAPIQRPRTITIGQQRFLERLLARDTSPHGTFVRLH